MNKTDRVLVLELGMSTEYRKNHYVPVWYQKRFIPLAQRSRELFYRDLQPGVFRAAHGRERPSSGIHRRGPKKCFAERDLYTTSLRQEPSTALEQMFFGPLDEEGKMAVERLSDLSYETLGPDSFSPPDAAALLTYMAVQKLRTPKGLGWLAQQLQHRGRDQVLQMVVALRNLYGAIWSECVWQIADASNSPTKLILTDHPVTIYNRKCGPRSDYCRGVNDPDIRYQASHTLFPLSLEKILILTNISWARDPYQSELELRPNPSLDRPAVFKLMDIHVDRRLTEEEVIQINFIMMSRAYRYIAAVEKEWIYPERKISKSDWATLGDGYLLMPDPRALHIGGTVYFGFDNGPGAAFDEFGRRPGDRDYEADGGDHARFALDAFQGEFARLYGPCRRGRTWFAGRLVPECDDERTHKRHLEMEAENKTKLRGRARRRHRRTQ